MGLEFLVEEECVNVFRALMLRSINKDSDRSWEVILRAQEHLINKFGFFAIKSRIRGSQ